MGQRRYPVADLSAVECAAVEYATVRCKTGFPFICIQRIFSPWPSKGFWHSAKVKFRIGIPLCTWLMCAFIEMDRTWYSGEIYFVTFISASAY
jgi:hypothetical protein